MLCRRVVLYPSIGRIVAKVSLCSAVVSLPRIQEVHERMVLKKKRRKMWEWGGAWNKTKCLLPIPGILPNVPTAVAM